jgi:hypothetical protein
MTPINQVFRLWLRRASTAERSLAGLAAVVVASLLAWTAVPTATDDVATASFPGAAPGVGGPASAASGPDAATGSGGPSGTGTTQPVAGGGGGTGPNAAGDPAAATPKCPPGTDQGASEKSVDVAITLIEVAGAAGNAAFGVPSADEQRAYYQAVIDSLNQAGGVGCRQIKPAYYTVNPVDTSAPHETCLRIRSAPPFIVFNNGALPSSEVPCLMQAQIPFVTPETAEAARKNYPLLFTLSSSDLIYRNAMIAWKQSGAFDSGGKLGKIGVIYHDCVPAIVDAVFDGLAAAGIPDSNITSYNLGDCRGTGSPADIQQAIAQFQREGVTHVAPAFMPSDFATFTKIAQGQGFRPRYRVADFAVLSVSYGALAPDWNNIDGALAMTNQSFGEEHTPSFKPSAETQRCNAIMATAGLPPVYQQPLGFGGVACSQLWLFEAMVEHAPTMARAALAQGLNAAGTVPYSYPGGPADFSTPGVTYGGQFFRPLVASAACRCWRVTDPTFKPGFP